MQSLLTIDAGTFLFGFAEENGGRFIGGNVTQGQTVIIPQGEHYHQESLTCSCNACYLLLWVECCREDPISASLGIQGMWMLFDSFFMFSWNFYRLDAHNKIHDALANL